MEDDIFDDACREARMVTEEAVTAERDRYRHALANIIARFGAKPLPKNEDEHGAYYEAEQMAMIAEEALGAESK